MHRWLKPCNNKKSVEHRDIVDQEGKGNQIEINKQSEIHTTKLLKCNSSSMDEIKDQLQTKINNRMREVTNKPVSFKMCSSQIQM